MARTAEVTTMQTLEQLQRIANAEFAKAAKGREIANKVKDVPDAFKTLNESASEHEQEAFKALRKIIVKVTNALTESSSSSPKDDADRLVKLARTMKLFPDTPAPEVKSTEPDKK